jgi:hypothetical protein
MTARPGRARDARNFPPPPALSRASSPHFFRRPGASSALLPLKAMRRVE